MAAFANTYEPPDAARAQRNQDTAAKLGLDLSLYQLYGTNPVQFGQQYGQFRDPTTGVFTIPGVTPGALIQNPNFAPATVLNPDGTPIRAGTSTASTGFSQLPAYLSGGGAPGGIPGLNEFFDPNFGRSETMTRANEAAIAGGYGSGGFAGGQALKLLDSERKSNILAGHQILEPYLERQSRASLQASENAARLNQIAAEGAQALQRLQLSEAGQGARLSAELAARLQDQVLAGQQAMQQLTLREAGETGRLNTSIQGNLAQTLLTAGLRPGTTGGGGTASGPTRYGTSTGLTGPLGVNPVNAFGQVVSSGPSAFNPNARGITGNDVLGLGSSSIDQLLRKYNLIP